MDNLVNEGGGCVDLKWNGPELTVVYFRLVCALIEQ